jgi:hypothetical protein
MPENQRVCPSLAFQYWPWEECAGCQLDEAKAYLLPERIAACWERYDAERKAEGEKR